MKKLVMTIEVEVEDYMYNENCQEETNWFYNEVLLNPVKGEELNLHSNCIGDSVGIVKVLNIHRENT